MLGLNSEIYRQSFTDPQIVALFSDAAEVHSLVRVESALAKVQGELGLIPANAASAIQHTLSDISLDPADLAEGCSRDGVVIPSLLKELRQRLPDDIASYLHWGATSQDIVDTALVLCLKEACGHMDQTLVAVGNKLAALAERERGTVMVARTRAQWAVPTLAGLKVANWLAPLARQRRRLAELKPRLYVVQLGGAAGTLAAMGEQGFAVCEALARELDLQVASAPWHTQRDSLLELGNWLSMTCGILGKMGQDLIVLTQSDVAEVKLTASGGSSTMPQKSNPVGPEALVTLARHSAGLLANLHNGAIQASERDGAAWALEWHNLPQLVCSTAGSLKRADETVASIEFDRARIHATLEETRGTILAEAMVFALAEHMDKACAQKLVKEACEVSSRSGSTVVDALKVRVDLPIDWDTLQKPENSLGSARLFIDSVLDDWRGF